MMKYLKAFIAVIFGLEKEPSAGDTIGALIGLIFISIMLLLSSGAVG